MSAAGTGGMSPEDTHRVIETAQAAYRLGRALADLREHFTAYDAAPGTATAAALARSAGYLLAILDEGRDP